MRWPNPDLLALELEAAGVAPGTVRERVAEYRDAVHELAAAQREHELVLALDTHPRPIA